MPREIGSDWMLYLFPHADDAYETAPACARPVSCMICSISRSRSSFRPRSGGSATLPCRERPDTRIACSRSRISRATISQDTFRKPLPRRSSSPPRPPFPGRRLRGNPDLISCIPANFWPHKNHEKLLAAFELLRKGPFRTASDPHRRRFHCVQGSSRRRWLRMAPAVSVTGYVRRRGAGPLDDRGQIAWFFRRCSRALAYRWLRRWPAASPWPAAARQVCRKWAATLPAILIRAMPTRSPTRCAGRLS